MLELLQPGAVTVWSFLKSCPHSEVAGLVPSCQHRNQNQNLHGSTEQIETLLFIHYCNLRRDEYDDDDDVWCKFCLKETRSNEKKTRCSE